MLRPRNPPSPRRPAPQALLAVLLGAALLGSVLLGPGGGVAEAKPEVVTTTKHFVIRGAGGERLHETAGSLLEALYAELDTHFGEAPPHARLPIPVFLHATATAFEKAVRAEGIEADLSKLGGYTVARTGHCHIAVQADPFHTRRLLIHEVVHGFQDRILRAGTQDRLPRWYREGIAEYYGWHRPIRGGWTFGAMDAIARGHRPREARERLRGPDYDPRHFIDHARAGDYTDALLLYRGLRDSVEGDVPKLLSAWERDVLRRGAGARTFKKRTKDIRRSLKETLRRTWAAPELPWIAKTEGWADIPGGIAVQGSPTPRFLERAPGATRRLDFVVHVEPGARGAAGFDFGFGKDTTRWRFTFDGRAVSLTERVDGAFVLRFRGPSTGRVRLTVEGRVDGLFIRAKGGHEVEGTFKPTVFEGTHKPDGWTDAAALRGRLFATGTDARFLRPKP